MSTAKKTTLNLSSYQRALDMQRIGNAATYKAQAQNRAKGIPNFYSVGGRIVSDIPGADPQLQPIKPVTKRG